MNFIINFFNKIYSLIAKQADKEEEKLEQFSAEIIQPMKFRYLEDNMNRSLRGEDESLDLFQSFLKADIIKQEEVAKSTRDYIIQRNILETRDDKLILHLALNINLDNRIQIIMAEDKTLNMKIRAVLSRKIGLSLDAQKILAKSQEPEIRRMLVRWQRPLNPFIARMLLDDPDLEVRKAIALNIGEQVVVDNVITFGGNSEVIQLKLIQDEDPEVRISLANNKNIFKKSQLSLAFVCIENKDFDTLLALACNQNLHPDCAEFIRQNMEMGDLLFQKRNVIRKLNENKNISKNKNIK